MRRAEFSEALNALKRTVDGIDKQDQANGEIDGRAYWHAGVILRNVCDSLRLVQEQCRQTRRAGRSREARSGPAGPGGSATPTPEEPNA
jgi:hypothetical protein